MWIMSTINEISIWIFWIRLFKSFQKLFQSFLIYCPNWQFQFTIIFFFIWIKVLIIANYPWKYRILIQIIICSPCIFINLHQILKIRHISLLPSLSEIPLLETFYRILHNLDILLLLKYLHNQLLILKYIE